MILGTFSCELRTPNDCGDCKLTEGSANCTVLNTLKNCALNSVLHRSLKRNRRDSATSRFHRDIPRSWPPAPLVVSIPTIAGRNELNTANGLANRFRPEPPVAPLPLIPT